MNIVAITRKGIHKTENEDRVIVGKNIIAEGVFCTRLENGIVAVADGVGGNNGGAAASHYVARQLSLLNTVSEEEFEKINGELLSFAFKCSNCGNMATTLSGIALHDGTAQIFGVGNTRVYLLQGGKYLKQLTTDDTTLNYLISSGRLTPEEVGSFNRKNEITACFGGGSASLFKMKYNEIECLSSPFVITSDGIHDYISVDVMEDIIEKNGITVSTCDEMISAARSAGSKDDISVVMGDM